MMDEREGSPLPDVSVLASFCGGGVSCCCGVSVSASHCRGLMRRGAVSMRRLGRRRFLLPLRGGGGCDRDAEKTSDGMARPTGGIFVSFAGESRDAAAAPLPVGIKDGLLPLAMGPVGVSGCLGEAKKERPLVLEPLEVGVSGRSGEAAANKKPPLGVGPVGVSGRSGAAKNANMFAALLASDPPGVVGALSPKANMFPAAAFGWIGRSPGSNENSVAAEGPAARGAKGDGGGVGAEGVGGGGGGGVPCARSKGASSSSILLRTEEAGRRQRRFLRPASAAQGAEKATAEGAGSMRSSARCRGAGGGVKKNGSSAMAMALWVCGILEILGVGDWG
ncbi:unnamed protein product [Urochloa decumbens]|uniref:Uncharacterized protein n=1 Tax=Urochloa decumbens TaxID=240449 RepID=A0ABC8WVG7_9POAL